MIRVQRENFDVGAEIATLCSGDYSIGGVASFVGIVRDAAGGAGGSMTLEHYPGMTEQVIEGLVHEASRRWDVRDARIIHRVGALALADQIVFVGVCSAHRGDAFSACEFIMDALKTSAPFWKKEITGDTEHWVEQKAADLDRTQSWD